jgi:hypothetical protein
VTESYSLSTLMPSPKRPGWVLPVMLAAIVVVVASVAVTAWALTRGHAAASPVSLAETTLPATTAAASKDPTIVAGCEKLLAADWLDFDQMAALARSFVTVADADIRIADTLLHDRAEIAIAQRAAGETTQQVLDDTYDVVTLAGTLLKSCQDGHYLDH